MKSKKNQKPEVPQEPQEQTQPDLKSSIKADLIMLCSMVLVLSAATIWYARTSSVDKPEGLVVQQPAKPAKPHLSQPGTSSPKPAPDAADTSLQPLDDPAHCINNTTLNVVAHQDDDLLFLSPDLVHDITAKRCIRSVYLTAGDAGQPYKYWHSRELAVESAYAYMYDLPNIWHESKVTINGHHLRLSTLDQQPSVGMIFMALPDGHPLGKGFGRYKNESLSNLRKGTLLKIHSVDGASSYTKQDLVETLRSIMNFDKPTEIHTQKPDNLVDGDHSDHHAAGYFTLLARNGYTPKNILRLYTGYPISSMPVNIINQQDLLVKRQTFEIYINRDGEICSTYPCDITGSYQKYLLRQYSTTVSNDIYIDHQRAYSY